MVSCDVLSTTTLLHHPRGMAFAERFARFDEKTLAFKVLLAQRAIEAL